jgi:hypothetical protein
MERCVAVNYVCFQAHRGSQRSTDMATQLRRYEVAEGGLDKLIEWFPTIAKVREQYGFTIDSVVADRENNEFVWVVSHPGDFDAALETYNASPERAAAFEGFASPVQEMHVAMVETVL